MKKLFIAILFAIARPSAWAQLILSFSGGNALSVGPGTAGYEFSVSTPVTERSLGIWDESGTGLTASHAVGIWDATTQSLLASTTVVPATATDINGFWYAALAAPLTLQAGHSYVIAAQYADVDLDLARGNVPTVVTGAGVTLDHAVLSTGTGFIFPDLTVAAADSGFFGPNAIATAVPEPWQWTALSALALLGFSALRRRGAWPFVTLVCALPLWAGPVREILDAKQSRRGQMTQKLTPEQHKILEPAVPPTNRPPVTPGNANGQRPVIPPGLRNYGSP